MAKACRPKRLRFTLRTLAIVVTLVCCYFGCWEATKRQGVEDVDRRHAGQDTFAVLPFVVRHDEIIESSVEEVDWGSSSAGTSVSFAYTPPRTVRKYSFWFFGFVAKLPFEREIEADFDFSIDHTAFGAGIPSG